MTDTARLGQFYKRAKTRLILLDYDGTLSEFTALPSQAKPTAGVLDLLARLSGDKRNTVVIISGRDQATLDDWLGHLPVTLVAEHGYATRPPGKAWRAQQADGAWKTAARADMLAAVQAIPGSHIEEKFAALVWHYRTAQDQTRALEQAKILLQRLRPAAKQYDLSILFGNKIVEAKPAHIHKGAAAESLLATKQWDFILAAGDDVTDEDLFAAMPTTAFTIKIGPGPTRARLHTANHAAFIRLLGKLKS